MKCLGKFILNLRLITADSIEEKLISLQTFKKYIANNIVDKNNIHETNLNVDNFMESLEDFSKGYENNGKRTRQRGKDKNDKNDRDKIQQDENEEMELEYLKKLV